MNNDLVVTVDEIERMTPSKVDELVERKTKEILLNIQACTDKIQEAKEASERAQEMEVGGFWGRGKRTAEKATATANALANTNEAVGELSKIVRESIAFTCLSMAFAQKMTESISQMMVEGFEDSNGNYISLSHDAKEQGEIILKQAKNFLNSQLQIKEIEEKQKQKDELDRKQDELISQNTERLNEKDKIDALQTKRLEELGDLLNDKDHLDQKQEAAIAKNTEDINLLFEKIKQNEEINKKQSEEIEKIKGIKSKNILSIVSFVISICAITLWLYEFLKSL